MGLFDFLFGKKTTVSKEDNTNEIQPQKPIWGHITTTKVEVTFDNYDEVCRNYIAFDTETTGLSADDDVIIEVGAVKFVEGLAVGSYGSLVDEGVPVPASAYRINHISTRMLEESGEAPEVVYQELVEFLGEGLRGKLYICAHNASFDMSFLESALERFGYSGTILYIDTLSLSRKLIKGLPNYKQDTVADYFGIKNLKSHRAVSDAEVCGKILNNLLALKKAEIDEERVKCEKCKPSDEEKEVISIIATAMKENGCNVRELRAYRNTSNYVLLIDTYIVLRFRLLKKKKYVVVPKSFTAGINRTEECTNTEGTMNVRLLFDDPFELFNYGGLFSKVFFAMKESQGKYMNEFEIQYLAQANLTRFTDTEFEQYIESAKKRQKLKAEALEIENQRKLEQEAIIEAKKAEKLKIRQETEKRKQDKIAEKIKQQEALAKLLENTIDISEEDIIQIAKMSAEEGKRAILQMDDYGHVLRVYGSVSEASGSVGFAPKTIRDAANGKYKHCGGFCWKYADEFCDGA